MLGMTVPRAGGNLVGLLTPHLTNDRLRTESWLALQAMDFEHRLAAIKDAAFRERLVDELRTDPRAAALEELMGFWYPLGLDDRPCYTAPEQDSLLGRARQRGVHPAEIMLEIMLQTEGRMVFHHREFNFDLDGLAKLLALDWMVPGMGDAGAHVGQMVDASWPTFVLGHWYRDAGLFSLEEAVRRISGLPASFLRLDDRGTLAVGKRADINVIDVNRVAERQPQIVNDFPQGAARFIQRAAGYAATVCNGAVVLRDDEFTGARAGKVLRSSN
jgi:N-acyl-D-amino-acid deacylase